MVAETFLVMSIPWVISNDIRPLHPLASGRLTSTSTPSIFSEPDTHVFQQQHRAETSFYSGNRLPCHTEAANEVLEGWKRIINTKNLLIRSNLEVYLDRNRNRLGIQLGEHCLAVRHLPAYAVVGIRTGEYTDEGRLWEAKVSFNE